MNSEQELSKLLTKGLYVHNLYAMASLCRRLALEAPEPATFFVMQQIFLGIAQRWEGRPVIVEDAKAVEARLIGPLKELLIATGERRPINEIHSLLNGVISAYLAAFS